MRLLGIETSCDETAAAIVDADRNILSNIVLSQIEKHKQYGGVVPEVAARAHIHHIDDVVAKALQGAGLTLDDIDGIAATCGPGLIGGVMIGMIYAKSLAWSKSKPFIAVNHLEGHALTPRLSHDVPYPFLLLLVSGGHSQLLIVRGVGEYEKLGSTLDDAAGECFDKAAKVMGLPYPGGPELEKLATECPMDRQVEARERYVLPSPLKGQKNSNFSFSGLKTAVIRHVEAFSSAEVSRVEMSLLAYAFQETISEIMADRCANAIHAFKDLHSDIAKPHFVVAGGVAANKAIRGALQALADQKGFVFTAPPMKLCTDNAAMIAWAGLERMQKGMVDSLDFKARPRWPLEELAIKQPAERGL